MAEHSSKKGVSFSWNGRCFISTGANRTLQSGEFIVKLQEVESTGECRNVSPDWLAQLGDEYASLFIKDFVPGSVRWKMELHLYAGVPSIVYKRM